MASIYAIQGIRPDGTTKSIHRSTEYGWCWAVFQERSFIGNSKEFSHFDVLFYTKDNVKPYVMAFAESDFFKRLTQGKVEVFKDVEDFHEVHLETGGGLHDCMSLRFDTTLGAARGITAFRLLTYGAGIGTNFHQNMPTVTPATIFAYNGMCVHKDCCSDSGITLAGVTGTQIRDHWNANAKNKGWEEPWDVYWGTEIGKIVGTGGAVSMEMLKRIWNRTDEEFEALCVGSHKNRLVDYGYVKDCEKFEDHDIIRTEDPEIVTISAPVTDVMLPGEEDIRVIWTKEHIDSVANFIMA